MADCTHECSSCGVDCPSRDPHSFLEPLNEASVVKKVIGVVSGKGGVGKSFVTSYLSVLTQRKGFQAAILDADLTGPSIPAAFGIHQKAFGSEEGILPAVTETGIKLISVNMMLKEEDAPVIWRGPVIAGVVKQFWTEVFWDEVDYMFVDMPPGTGDVPLTVFQSIPLDGIVVVTSPQEVVSLIVSKAVNMAKQMNIPILGIVENYSYVLCPHCAEKIRVFGESHSREVADRFGLKFLGALPLDPSVAAATDAGRIEYLELPEMGPVCDDILAAVPLEE